VKINVEIPDKTYSDLKKHARREHQSINALIVQSIRSVLGKEPVRPRRRIKLPVIDSDRPGSLHLDNKKIYQLIDFP
jgi:hypothetical protein